MEAGEVTIVKLPSGLWTATATPASPSPQLEGEQRADVCIIGGFRGLSAALDLAESGASVIVLEAGEVGAGASGRNGGQMIPGLKLDPSELEALLGPERGARLTEIAGGAADFSSETCISGLDDGFRRVYETNPTSSCRADGVKAAVCAKCCACLQGGEAAAC